MMTHLFLETEQFSQHISLVKMVSASTITYQAVAEALTNPIKN